MAATTEAGLRIVLFYKYGSTDRLYLDLIVTYFCTEREDLSLLCFRCALPVAVSVAAATHCLHLPLVYCVGHGWGRYVGIKDVEGVCEWQQQLAGSLGLLGRVLLAAEGINGSLSGSSEGITAYVAAMARHALFGGIDWKYSDGSDGERTVAPQEQPFGDLLIKVVKELVSTGGAVTLADVHAHGGTHLSPHDFHDAVSAAAERDDVVLLDVRNKYESAIGNFEGATPVPMSSFSEYIAYAKQMAPHWREKKVLMYCTGGIRCEKASAFLRKQGVADVSQLNGGIHRYLEKFPTARGGSKWRGKNFVFDRRMSQLPTSGGDSSSSDGGSGSLPSHRREPGPRGGEPEVVVSVAFPSCE